MDEKPESPLVTADRGAGSPSLGYRAPSQPCRRRPSSIFVFNPFAEAYMAHGKAFTPVKQQAMLAEDLASLPQFLCEPDDVVLLPKRPSATFQNVLRQAGFAPPEFIELKGGRIDPDDDVCRRKLGRLRPWAWAPDSLELLEPLFLHVGSGAQAAGEYFNDEIARLYSKAWSAGFLRKVLAHCRGRPDVASAQPWLCSEPETGVVADTLEDTLGAIAAIRSRGHHRIVVKEAYGVAGNNAIRLWEPEILPAQRKWLARAVAQSRQVVVEPWLDRALDFSVQLEMEPGRLKLCGYTGLVNDRKGQFLANWAEPGYACLPSRVAALFASPAEMQEQLQHFYMEIFRLLEPELQRVGFVGPISVDAFVYRTPEGGRRLKPVVEINPRYTMGRVTLELMKHACPGTCGLFRLMNRSLARAEGFADLSSYACSLGERVPLHLEGGPAPRIRQGGLCLNDPGQAQICLATFEVGPLQGNFAALCREAPARLK